MAANLPPIIIKKVKKGGHGGHHGGAWKVAYADFVTAMMAFFLLLWLLGSTTDEQKQGIADYFAPTSRASTSNNGSGMMLAGRSMDVQGVMNSSASSSFTIALAPPASRADEDPDAEESEEVDIGKALAEREEEMFRQAEEALRQAIQKTPDLKELAENLIVDRTEEGLRIQIVDRDGVSMFSLGSAIMQGKTRTLLAKVAEVVRKLPNRLAITGHTDATPYRGGSGYGNWELSSDRANASRRALVESGLPDQRIARVAGRAALEPLIADDPSSSRNRRISIVLLHRSKDAEQVKDAEQINKEARSDEFLPFP
jgi:chemotaxis protein MotB